MNDTLEPLPLDIVDKLNTVVPPPLPPQLAAALLPGIHAAAAVGTGLGASAVATAVPWWLMRVPLWVPLATLFVGAAGGVGVASVMSKPLPPSPPAPPAQTAAPDAPPAPEVISQPPVKEPAPAPPVPRPAKVEPPAATVDHLREERVLIEAARASMGRNPEEGLVALEQHERAFPKGQLREEREALAVQLLLRLGRTQAAKTRFDAFARAFPNSALLGVLGPAFATIDAGR